MSHPIPTQESSLPEDLKQELEKKEAFVAFLGQDLATVRAYMDNLRSSWNGEDSKFIHEGEIYSEDHVNAAEDIIAKIDDLQEALNDF